MKSVLALACALVLAQQASATCDAIPSYTTTFVPSCSGNDVYVKWPNYEDFSKYYECNGVGEPVLTSCPTNTYFTYVLQECASCTNFIPAVQCKSLKTQYPPNCYPIDGSGTTPDLTSTASTTSSYPTPHNPTDTTTPETTTTTPETTTTTPETTTTTPETTTTTPEITTTAPEVSTTACDTTEPVTDTDPPTPPTETTPNGSSSATDIPPPPSPATSDPDVPMPPTPDPTPPSVSVKPPTAPPVQV